MSTKNEKITVEVFEVLPYNPADPTAAGAKVMRPTPMESYTGRWARVQTKRAVKAKLEAAGHTVKSVAWAEDPRRIVVYIVNPQHQPPARPSPPPPLRPRRTAVSRRHPAPAKKG